MMQAWYAASENVPNVSVSHGGLARVTQPAPSFHLAFASRLRRLPPAGELNR